MFFIFFSFAGSGVPVSVGLILRKKEGAGVGRETSFDVVNCRQVRSPNVDSGVDLGGLCRFFVWIYTGSMESSGQKRQALAGRDGREIEEAPAWVLDVLLGILVALVIAVVISAEQGGSQEPDAVAYLFAAGFGALMLVRRRFPVIVLAATMLMLSGYYILDYPAIGLAVPVAAALYSAAEFGHLRAALVISLLLVVTSTYFRYIDGETIAFLLGYELVSTVTLMAAAIALGDSTRSRRALRAEQEEIARLIRQEHAHRAEQRVEAERMRMARELHDVIGHSISVISLHTNVAREAVGRDDEATRQALGYVRAAASEAMQELRATVKVLRQPPGKQEEQATQPASSQPLGSLRALGTLVEHARSSGLTVDVELTGAVDGLPGTVDTAAFRIIQESLTNVMRHAHATRVAVVVQAEPQAVRLRVTDNGRAKAKEVGAGSGIAGMRERARLLGGRLTAEALAAGGFEVRATLPLEDGA